MNVSKLSLLLLIVGSFAIAGCDRDDGVAERAGQAMDKTVDGIQESATDAGNAIEDACEDVKKNAGADDTDC